MECAGDVAIGGRVGADGVVEGGGVVLHGGRVTEGVAWGQLGGGRMGVLDGAGVTTLGISVPTTSLGALPGNTAKGWQHSQQRAELSSILVSI